MKKTVKPTKKFTKGTVAQWPARLQQVIHSFDIERGFGESSVWMYLMPEFSKYNFGMETVHEPTLRDCRYVIEDVVRQYEADLANGTYVVEIATN